MYVQVHVQSTVHTCNHVLARCQGVGNADVTKQGKSSGYVNTLLLGCN